LTTVPDDPHPRLGAAPPRRIGLIGAGAVATLHAAAIERMPDGFTLVAVVDPDVERASRLADLHGAQPYDHHVAMTAETAIDAAIVASPNAAHHRQVLDLLERGVPTLVEKPMAATSAEACHMAQISAERSVPLFVGHVQRYLPRVASARRLVADGAIGELVMIVDQYSSRYEPGSRPAWFLDPELSPHGILANLGCHILDRCLLFSGGMSIDVSAAWLRSEGVPAEVAAQLTLENGLAVTMLLTGTGLPSGETTQLVGTDGAIRLQTAAGLELYRRGELVYSESPGASDDIDAFEAQLLAFGRTLDGAAPVVDAAYGIAIMEAIERIARVAQRG
jgi:predicted dehydrogenase